MDIHQILGPLLAMLAVGGGVLALAYPLIVGGSQADKRKAALQTRSPAQLAGRVNDVAKRRKQVAESLKELDARSKSKKLTIETKLLQAGIVLVEAEILHDLGPWSVSSVRAWHYCSAAAFR